MSHFYDTEFERLLCRAREIIMKINNIEGALIVKGIDHRNLCVTYHLSLLDRRICAQWVAKLCKLQSENIAVKKDRNGFFKYMLQVIGQGTLAGPFLSIPDQGPLPNFTYSDEQGNHQASEDDEPVIITRWSDDKRTYVAVKAIPNQGAIIYMAVAKDPTQGWEIPQSDSMF
ncbi:uncharacterized protein [Hetaerina americana]|uniref:uncharacterized protein n=1 Tax=Hetaerina americana TaxID=62018 RepID=UPI003A7F1461